MTILNVRPIAWVLLCLALLPPTLIQAADAVPKSVTTTGKVTAAKPSTGTAKESALTDTVLFSTDAGKHEAIGRMAVTGKCKRFLSQARGKGWVSSLPIENKADDLGGVGSPDGKWIAFYSNRNGALNIWIAKADGSSAEALTAEETDIADLNSGLREQLAFSPDSSHVAFIMHGDLWTISLSDRGLVSLSHGQGVKALAWSPNGFWIAYVQGSSLRRIGLSGAPLEVLASGHVIYPTISWVGDSDKGSLLFFGYGLQRVNMERKVDLLWPSLLSPNRVQGQPGTTEKGLVLAPLSSGSNELFYVDFTGKTRHASQVTRGGAEDGLFLPDGTGFIFKRKGRLWRCNLDGTQAKPITDVSIGTPWLGRLAPMECN